MGGDCHTQQYTGAICLGSSVLPALSAQGMMPCRGLNNGLQPFESSLHLLKQSLNLNQFNVFILEIEMNAPFYKFVVMIKSKCMKKYF